MAAMAWMFAQNGSGGEFTAPEGGQMR